MRRLAILSILQVVLAVAAPPISHAQESRGRYIVVLKRGSDPDAKAKEHGHKYGVNKRAVYRHAIDGYSASVPESRVDDLGSDPDVTSVFPDLEAHAAAQTTPTGVSRIRTSTNFAKGTGINVAMLDTGIDLNHPDLAANIAGGKNCSDGSSYNDSSSSGHGTHVAGIVAALDNSIGVRGVVPEAKLWAVRVLDDTGTGDYESLICGLDFVDSKSPAKGGPITIANMSIEASGPSNIDDNNCGNSNGDALHQAVCHVVADGVTMVVAAGNHTADVKSIVPATYNEVITVSALSDSDGAPCGLGSPTTFGNADDTFADFSNYATLASDKAHMIGAPGDDIRSTMNDGGYDRMSGTSMASPHVVGAAALYIAAHPGSTPVAVRAGLLGAGEMVGVNFEGECTGGISHTDPGGKNPERVLRIAPWPPSGTEFKPAVTRGNVWYLNLGFDGFAEQSFAYGSSGDRQVMGDWDGDGKFSAGVVKGNHWFLNDGTDANADHVFFYGSATDRIVVGDWNGDGTWTPGVIRGNVWYLNNQLDSNADVVFAYGRSTDVPVVGDWDGDGDTTAGLVRGNTWYLNDGNDPNAEHVFVYGLSGDRFLAGDWDGDGTFTPAIVRGNVWYLNGGFDPFADLSFRFGNPTDFKLVGDFVVGP